MTERMKRLLVGALALNLSLAASGAEKLSWLKVDTANRMLVDSEGKEVQLTGVDGVFRDA